MHRTPYLVKSELVPSINDIEKNDHSNTLFLLLFVINFPSIFDPSTMEYLNRIYFRFENLILFILILIQAGVKRSKICILD